MKKVVLITGASRGIGKAIAIKFAKEGYRVCINYNKSEREAEDVLNSVLKSGGEAISVKADVSKEAEVEAMFSEIEKIYGGVDILVNNAGISCDMMLSDTTEEIYESVMNTNMGSVYRCTKRALSYMVNKKWGRIINISSIWGIAGGSMEVVYSASKAAVIGFTKALSKELGPSNITVNCIAPGVIDTDMNKNLTTEDIEAIKEETPLGKIGTGEDIAASALFFAASSGDFITGQVLSPNGGFVI